MNTPQKSRRSKRPPTPPKILKILATTDFSEASRVGVRYAVALADKLGSTVALLHVVEPRTWLTELGSLLPVPEDSKMVAASRAHLATLTRREGKGAVAVTSSVAVRAGNPFHAITTVALERAVNLIVIATRGHTGTDRFLLGSTAERVVRHAPCPVLTVPARTKPKRAGKTPRFKVRKILVPTDFSKLSAAALAWAGLLATRFGAELVLLHVVERFPIDYVHASELSGDVFLPLTKKAGEDLAHLAASVSAAHRITVSAIVGDGNPFDVICRTAEALGADLIVQTTHGRTGLKRVLLGSTAERVVRHSACPVLTVRELNPKKS